MTKFRFSTEKFEQGIPFWIFCESPDSAEDCRDLQVQIQKNHQGEMKTQFVSPLGPVPMKSDGLWGLELSLSEPGSYRVKVGSYDRILEVSPSSTLSFGFEFGAVASAVFAVLLILFVWMKRRENPYKKMS